QDRIVSEYASRKAQQKIFWVLLRHVTNPAHVIDGGRDEMYSRWCTSTQMLLSDEDLKTDITGNTKSRRVIDVKDHTGDMLQEWRNCMGFLAALSGACMGLDRPLRVISKGKLVNSNGPVNVVETLMDQLIELLICEN